MDTAYHFHHTKSYPKEYKLFLLDELKVGKKYILLEVHRSKPLVGYLLSGKIHMLCSVTDDHSIYSTLKTFGKKDFFSNLLMQEGRIPLADDFVDIAFLDDSALSQDITQHVQELNRVLRLNSFVILTQRRISLHTSHFSKHLHTFLSSRYASHTTIAPAASRSQLSELFNDGAYTKDINYQQHVSLDELIDFLELDIKTEDLAYKKIAELFDQHQENGKVVLGLVLQVSYGVFNKYTPEISLRRSVFFHALRPFAFLFYVMVKSNIYFLRLLYKMKDFFTKKK